MKKGIVALLGLAAVLASAASAQAPPAPKIVKPAPGTMNAGGVTLKVEPAPGAETKSFMLDWQAKAGGKWTARDILDAAGLGDQKVPAAAFKGASEWRVRARAIEGENASWSEWREFRTPAPAAKKTPCSNRLAIAASYDVSGTPPTLKAGVTLNDVEIKVTNLGTRTWGADSEVRLSYHWVKGGATIVRDGEATPLVRAVRPCGTAALKATLKAPAAPGTYTLKWDVFREGTGWFSAKGVATGDREVTVTP